MSKIICDVCGTVFPETATNCPICGCAIASNAQTVDIEDTLAEVEDTTANQYARGGRFAKNNVKQNTARNKAPAGRYSGSRNEKKDAPQGSNKGLVAVVIILLLAIVMVMVYIGVNVFLMDLGTKPNSGGENQTTGAGQESNSTGTSNTVACTEIKLGSKLINFTAANEQQLLAVQLTPENTTDKVIYTSSDPEIVSVSTEGLVVPVGYGQVTITVTCGSITEECTVISTVGDPPVTTAPTQPIPTAPAGFVLKLVTYKDSGEITISKEGASHMLYKETSGVKGSDILWETTDPSVAIVEDGKVIGVDRGQATITATIGDQTATCLVRCAFDAAEPTEPPAYTISNKDVTLQAGKNFFLSLKDSNGAKAQNVEWIADKEGIVEIDDSKITATNVSKSVIVNVYTEYEGTKYSCIVRVIPATED